MIYTDRDKLTVIELDAATDRISFDILAGAILERPSNMIYCVTERDQLFGIISMGDIARAGRAGDRHVKINKNFTGIMKNEYMKARKLFCKKKSINALPVINENNMLLGDYTRWDDLKADMLCLKGTMSWFSQHCNCVYLVYPCTIFNEKKVIFEVFRDYLLSQRIKVISIEHSEIINFLKDSNWILFVDENEFRAMDTLYTYIWNKNLKGISFYTYKKFMREWRYETEEVLRNIREKGVYVFNLVCERNTQNNMYMQKLEMDISKKYATIGERVSNRLHPDMYQDFFDNLYSEEYANNIVDIDYQIETKSGCGKLRDCHSKVYNVVKGERHTFGQPKIYGRSIYFVGACYMYGHYSEDRYTIESFLQKNINEMGYKIKIVNCGSPAYSEVINLALARILTLPLRKGDIVIYGENGGDSGFRNIDKINLADACHEYNIPAEWLVNNPMHCNHKLNYIYAKTIYNKLESILQENDNQGELIDSGSNYIKTIYIDRYFKCFNSFMYNKIGSIVMNCNPFTYGHRY